MSETRHTPGPWTVWNAYSNRDELFALRIGPNYEGGIEGAEGYDLRTTEANAHLISAAPEMYEALRDTAGIRAALSKARGEQKA